MALDSASRLGKYIASIRNDSSQLAEVISPNDTDPLDKIFNSEQIILSGLVTGTRKYYALTSFILDHPVLGCLDAPTSLAATDIRAYYTFPGAIGTDQSTYGQHSTDYTATLTTDAASVANSAANFSGTQYMKLPNTSTIISSYPFTLAASFNMAATSTSNSIVVLCRSVANSTAVKFYVGTSALIMQYRDSATTTHDITVTNISTSTWYHTAVTYDGTSYKTYFNGAYVNTTTNDFIGFGAQNAWIGARGTGTDRFTGKIDNVLITSRVLDATEISNLYTATKYALDGGYDAGLETIAFTQTL